MPLFSFLNIFVLGVASFTEFASNTATANIFLPVLAVTAVEVEIHPLALLLPAVSACPCEFCLRMATLPNALRFLYPARSFQGNDWHPLDLGLPLGFDSSDQIFIRYIHPELGAIDVPCGERRGGRGGLGATLGQ